MTDKVSSIRDKSISKFLIGRGLTDEQLQSLESSQTSADVRALLADHLGIGYESDTRRREIVLDFHFYNYAFCKEQGFNPQATAAFMLLMNQVWQDDMDTGEGPPAEMQASFNKMVDVLLTHSVEHPPDSVKVFEREHVSAILDFTLNNYFRQYRLYQYIFTSSPRMVISQS